MSHISLVKTIGKSVFLVFLLVLLAGVSQVLGAEGITGDWEVTMDFNGRQIFARLSISKRADGVKVSCPISNSRIKRSLLFACEGGVTGNSK